MATMQGITGKLSGKMGSAVFRVREGQQVVTQYNPIVKNPNTSGQQSQRAAFKLMSQLAAIMSPGFGTMSVAKRKAKGGTPSQRNAFTSQNFPLVVVTTEENEVVAKIPMEQLQLTSSFRPLPPLQLTTSYPDIEVSMSGIPSDVTTIRVIAVGYNQGVAGIEEIVDVPVTAAHMATTSITTNHEGNFTVLAYGLIPSESAKSSIDLDNIHTPADEDFISAVELNAMVAEGSMAETKTVGANIAHES